MSDLILCSLLQSIGASGYRLCLQRFHRPSRAELGAEDRIQILPERQLIDDGKLVIVKRQLDAAAIHPPKAFFDIDCTLRIVGSRPQLDVSAKGHCGQRYCCAVCIGSKLRAPKHITLSGIHRRQHYRRQHRCDLGPQGLEPCAVRGVSDKHRVASWAQLRHIGVEAGLCDGSRLRLCFRRSGIGARVPAQRACERRSRPGRRRRGCLLLGRERTKIYAIGQLSLRCALHYAGVGSAGSDLLRLRPGFSSAGRLRQLRVVAVCVHTDRLLRRRPISGRGARSSPQAERQPGIRRQGYG
ncbi:Uncharacterised protein [Mycobacterium tuberculosis]|nr:Uncharacterised protein [Mycobacterium tuberculosis]